jgi:hypothetical protein
MATSDAKKGLHAEEILANELKRALGDKYDPGLVKKLYSERIPCAEPGHDCYRMISDNFPNAEVEYLYKNSPELRKDYYPNYDKFGSPIIKN